MSSDPNYAIREEAKSRGYPPLFVQRVLFPDGWAINIIKSGDRDKDIEFNHYAESLDYTVYWRDDPDKREKGSN